MSNLLVDIPSATKIARPYNSDEDWSYIQPERKRVVSGGSSSQQTIKDITYDVTTGATIQITTDVKINVPLGGYAYAAAVFSSTDATVATVNQSGVVTPVSEGSCFILVVVPGLRTRKIPITVTQSGGGSVSVFNSFASGSLGSHLQLQIQSLLSGKTPPTFSGSPPYPYDSRVNLFQPNGSKNNAGWWGSTDVSFIPQSGGRNGCKVSPRDVIKAAHFQPYNLVDFYIGTDGGFYSGTIDPSKNRVISGGVGDGSDILVCTYTQDLPAVVSSCPVLPANFRHYLPQDLYPIVFTNQDKTLLVGMQDQAAGANILIGQATVFSSMLGWWYPVRILDSGAPAFMRVNGKLNLITDWEFGGGEGGGPLISDNITQINAAMAANGSPYSLTQTDISAFNFYS